MYNTTRMKMARQSLSVKSLPLGFLFETFRRFVDLEKPLVRHTDMVRPKNNTSHVRVRLHPCSCTRAECVLWPWGSDLRRTCVQCSAGKVTLIGTFRTVPQKVAVGCSDCVPPCRHLKRFSNCWSEIQTMPMTMITRPVSSLYTKV